VQLRHFQFFLIRLIPLLLRLSSLIYLSNLNQQQLGIIPGQLIVFHLLQLMLLPPLQLMLGLEQSVLG
jgi:hypothetical protein